MIDKDLSMGNTISLKSISDLLDYHFVIPSYQRGYRWTEQEVRDLLDDIWEFAERSEKPKDEFYCLQPVIVSKDNTAYSVIDGQQRLTTIHIILSFLQDIRKLLEYSCFGIEYETRKNSQEFLNHIDFSRRTENVDYFHICNAYEAVTQWFGSRPGSVKVDFLNCLLRDNEHGNNVRVIWYQIDQTADPVDIFTRINLGKIPLTNAELVKALFLRTGNFSGDEDTVRLRQLETANEWDNIESNLQNEDMWRFLTNEKDDYENRIEFIFDLMANSSASDIYRTFRFFNDRFKSSQQAYDAWREIKRVFLTFSEWFEDRKYYHLIGYLIAQGESVKELRQSSMGMTKSEFEQDLKNRIRRHVRWDINQLDYESDSSKIKKVLLLFNVVTLLRNAKSNARFQFGRFKSERWDIEHIHSVESQMPEAPAAQIDWLKEVLKLTDEPHLKDRIFKYVNSTTNAREEFVGLYTDVLKHYSEGNQPGDVNDISNLALLDIRTNRGYKNAIFPVKRKVIIEKDMSETFVPVCTKNVFLKYYTEDVNQMIYWGKADRKAYMAAIRTTLADYLQSEDVVEL